MTNNNKVVEIELCTESEVNKWVVKYEQYDVKYLIGIKHHAFTSYD